MQVSFKYNEPEGFTTNVDGKSQINIKNSITNNTRNFAPTELLLLGIGGCTSDDVLSILRKMKQNVVEYQCEINAEREEEIPKTLKKANIHYKFQGDLDPEKVRKAINLSLVKYCSVSIIVKRGGAKVTYSFSINGQEYDKEQAPELTE